MDTEEKTDDKLTAKDVAAIVAVAVVVTGSCILAGKIINEVTGSLMDAAVDTITLRKRKKSSEVHKVTDLT